MNDRPPGGRRALPFFDGAPERDVDTRDVDTPRRSSIPETASSRRDVEDQIHELEERLKRLIGEREPDLDGAGRSEPKHRRSSRPPPSGAAETLLDSEFYRARWGRSRVRERFEPIDDLGYDPAYEARLAPLVDFLYRRYFRVSCTGIENIPAEGRCLLVGNHSGTVPLDGLMVRAAVRREHPRPRDVRWLTEDFLHHFPFLGTAGTRLGAVRACQENAERLLSRESLVCVFPEGVKGIGKLFGDRYRLQRFGRGGFVKLCLRTQTPIVPLALVGGEETNPLLARVEQLGKAFGLPYVPITPTFPLLGPLGLLPAPTKWSIAVGPPVPLGSYGPEDAEDEIVVERLTERVRATLQGMVDGLVADRKSVFFG